MTVKLLKPEFLDRVSVATDLSEVAQVVSDIESLVAVKWIPVGRENNRGAIEAATDPGRSLVERLTNAIDAVIERKHEEHSGIPECGSPRAAAEAWFNVPVGGMSDMHVQKEREKLAKSVSTIVIEKGQGEGDRTVSIRDQGTGVSSREAGKTILSLSESNKTAKSYVAGAYGQGGSSTFAASKLTAIVSKSKASKAFLTFVKFIEPPPNVNKIGYYAYLVSESDGLPIEVESTTFGTGTLVKHFGYDLARYASPLGERSVYGLLRRVLFDPVVPVWLEDRTPTRKPNNRTIDGARAGLLRAFREGGADEEKRVVHYVPPVYVPLEGLGRVGIEYWVLQPPTKTNKRPTSNYIAANRPVILTLMGQNQAEMPISVVRKESGLNFLALRFVGHITCDSLDHRAKRKLFVSNREDARKGVVLDRIRSAFVELIKSDDQLRALNDEARAQSIRERDQSAEKEIRSEVARLLKVQGIQLSEVTTGTGVGSNLGGGGGGGGGTPTQIQLREPPTYIKFVNKKLVKLHPGQSKYIRVETDALSKYHDPLEPARSRINVIVETVGRVESTTALVKGRMRLRVTCPVDSAIGTRGAIRLELSVPGRATLFSEIETLVVAVPTASSKGRRRKVPPFEIREVHESDSTWDELGWSNPASVGYSTDKSEDKLILFYNADLPDFSNQRRTYENTSAAVAAAFKTRFEVWLAVHALLQFQEDEGADSAGHKASGDVAGDGASGDIADDDAQKKQRELVRYAKVAVMFAKKEIEQLRKDVERTE